MAADAIKKEREAADDWEKAQKAFKAVEKEYTSMSKVAKFRDKYLSDGPVLEKYNEAVKNFREAAQLYAAQKERTDNATSDAILAVQGPYGVKPKSTQYPNSKGLGIADWSPTFNRAEVQDSKTGRWRLKTKDELDKEHIDKPLGPAAGFTAHDTAEIKINQDAFSSPEKLAAVIVHETVHWEDIARHGGYTKREITPAVKFELEERAYRIQARFYRSVGDNTAQAKRLEIANRFASQHRIAKNQQLSWHTVRTTAQYRDSWIGIQQAFHEAGSLDDQSRDFDVETDTLEDIRESARRIADDSHESVRARGENDFLSSFEELGAVAKESRKFTAQTNEADEKRRAVLKQAKEERDHTRRAEQEARNQAAWRYIVKTVGLACSDPDSVAEIAKEGGLIGVGLYSFTIMSFLENAQNEVGWKSLETKLSSCEEDLVNRLVRAKGPIDGLILVGWANDYRAAHPSFVARLKTAIEEFNAAREEHRVERERARERERSEKVRQRQEARARKKQDEASRVPHDGLEDEPNSDPTYSEPLEKKRYVSPPLEDRVPSRLNSRTFDSLRGFSGF